MTIPGFSTNVTIAYLGTGRVSIIRQKTVVGIDTAANALVADTIKRSFYVDDMLKSVDTVEDGREVIRGTKQVLKHGGFNLTKFIVKDNALLQEVMVDDRPNEFKELMPDILSKALGIRWEVLSDCFCYVNKSLAPPNKVTKRLMLSQVSSMYDPLGLIAPIVHKGKMLFQEATRIKLDWDDSLPSYLAENWLNCLSSLSE